MGSHELNEQQVEPVPYITHEADMARMERTNFRLWIVVLALIVLLVGTNVAWLYYENQFIDYEETITQEVDTGDGMALVSGTGDVNYGESQTDSKD